MTFEPHTQTNPRAHSRGPFALRYAGGRPEGSYETPQDAASQARSAGAAVVTRDGWWIVGRVRA